VFSGLNRLGADHVKTDYLLIATGPLEFGCGDSCKESPTWRVRRFLRPILADSRFFPGKMQIGLFLLGELSSQRAAG
jgi:hypothetical protein